MTQTVVGAILVDPDTRRVLAARRTYPADLAGRWEFPGGKVHAGETPAQALARELGEELAIEATIGEELTNDGGSWPIDERYELRLFLAELANGEPTTGHDHDEVRWLTSDELESVDWLPSDQQAIPALQRHLR